MREALSRNYDARHWNGVNIALEGCTFHLCHTSAAQGAATILGHLELHPPAFPAVVDIRRESVEALAEIPNAAEYSAKGVAMDRHEIVAYALAQLDDH
jgi:hypothetical protein